MDGTTIAELFGVVLVPTATIVGAILQTSGRTRDQIDALRKDLGARIDAISSELGVVKRDVALLSQRVDALTKQVESLPSVPVSEADCRARHEETNDKLADLMTEIARAEAHRAPSQPQPTNPAGTSRLAIVPG